MTIEELQIELQNNPRSLNFVRLADMYLAENMVDAAFQLLERSLKYHPNSISGHLLIGKIFVLRSDFDKALEHLNFCVQKAPTNWQALLTRAELHLKTQKPKPALADFKSVLLHNPQNPIARKMVAKLEVISADDYESDVFEIKTIQDLPSPTAYSPLPQASSSVMGLLFLKNAFHFPFMCSGYCNTFGKVSISAKRTSFF